MSIFFLVGIIQYYPFLSHIKNVRTPEKQLKCTEFGCQFVL